MKKIFPVISLHIGTTVGVILGIITLIFTMSIIWALLIGTSAALLISLLLPLYFMRSERAYKKLAAKVKEKKVFYEWIKLVIGNAAVEQEFFSPRTAYTSCPLAKTETFVCRYPRARLPTFFLKKSFICT